MVKINLNLNNFWVMDELKSLFSDLDLGYNIIITESGTIMPDINKCPCCKKSLLKNGYNECKNEFAKGFGLIMKKGRLVCSTPGCRFKINIDKSVFNKWWSKLLGLVLSTILSLGAKKVSPGNIATHIRETHGISLSEEYVRLKLEELTNNIECPNPQEEPSGVVVHDEQFIKIKGVDFKRISAVDANNSYLL